MTEKRYIISDASRMLEVEAHVLRYWEEELSINIPRNEMGHRYYTENHINLLRNIRDLKKQGYGLRAIKMMITDHKDNHKNLPGKITVSAVEPEIPNTKMEQFQEIMDRIVSKAMKESTVGLGKELSDNVSENVLKGMNYIMRIQDEKEEERYKKLDEAMRSRQRLSHRERRKKLKAEKLLAKNNIKNELKAEKLLAKDNSKNKLKSEKLLEKDNSKNKLKSEKLLEKDKSKNKLKSEKLLEKNNSKNKLKSEKLLEKNSLRNDMKECKTTNKEAWGFN